MPNITFVCDTDIDGGLGHFSRCFAIANTIFNHVNIDIEFWGTEPNPMVTEKLPKHFKFKPIWKTPTVRYMQMPLVKNTRDRIFVFDTKYSYKFIENASEVQKVFIDPHEYLDPEFIKWDGIIFPHSHATTLRIQNAVDCIKEGGFIKEGKNWVLIPNFNPDLNFIPRSQRTYDVSFTCGASDPEDIISNLYTMMNTHYYVSPNTDHMDLCFILGRNYNGLLKLNAAQFYRSKRFDVKQWDLNIVASSRMMVTMMGVSVYEFLYMGIPCLVIPRHHIDQYAIQELVRNMQGWVGALPYIEYCSSEAIVKQIKNIIKRTSQYENDSAIYRDLIGDIGNDNIAKLLYSLVM